MPPQLAAMAWEMKEMQKLLKRRELIAATTTAEVTAAADHAEENNKRRNKLMTRILILLTFFYMLGLCSTAGAADFDVTGQKILDDVIATIFYSCVGMVMTFFAIKVIDIMTPGGLGHDISQNPIALAILTGLTVLGICIIIAAVLAS